MATMWKLLRMHRGKLAGFSSHKAISSTEPWVVLQHAPAHLRQRWQDLKLGLQKEMQQHQQAVAWSAIGAPCLGAPAGADLLTDSHATSPCWGATPNSNSSTNGSNNSNSNNNNCNGSNSVQTTEHSVSENGDWRPSENIETCESNPPYQYQVKAEPSETEDMATRYESSSPPPQVLSPPPQALSPPAQHCSPIVLSASAPGGNGVPPPSEQYDGPPPPKNKKHNSSQTNLPIPCSEHSWTKAESELRLKELRRAQQRAEEIHHEHLRESRARADAAQAERDHRLQLIRHAEEMHQQALEAQRQAIEHNRQLHEITLRQAHKTCD